MRSKWWRRGPGALLLCALQAAAFASAEEASAPSADEIVRQCENHYAGRDQRTRMTVVNRNKDGQERKSIYLRLLKNYAPGGEALQKMVLVTEFPPEGKGLGFMRWEYDPQTGKFPDQWVYVPSSRNYRRISVRDPSESFLGTTLTLGDIALRRAEDDSHQLLGVERSFGGEWWVIESVPKESNSMYSKRVSRYAKTPTWDQCVKVQVDYFDTKGIPLKTQRIQWQKVNDAWLWAHVEVVNTQTQQSSIFDIHDVEINPGLDDSLFTERNLAKNR